MTIEAKLDETNRLLGILVGIATSPASAVTVPPAAEQPKPTRTRAAKPADPTPPVKEPEATPVDDDFDAPAGGAEAPKLTKADARAALVALQKAKNSAEASRGILNALKLPSLGSLKDDDAEKIKAIIDACKAQMPKQ